MTSELCHRCGKTLPLGSLKYTVVISIVSEFDGILDVDEAEDIEKEIGEILDTAETTEDPSEMENEVYQRLAFTLCPSCRKEFVANPLGGKGGPVGLVA